jgi:hypothetical protein
MDLTSYWSHLPTQKHPPWVVFANTDCDSLSISDPTVTSQKCGFSASIKRRRRNLFANFFQKLTSSNLKILFIATQPAT